MRRLPPAPSARRGQGGFTLVEMLLALLIFALIAVSGTAMTRFVLDGRGDLAERQARVAELQVARALIRADLLNAVPRPWRPADGGPPQGMLGGVPDGDGPLLAFLRGGWENPGAVEDRGTQLHVTYVLEEGRLLRRTALRPDPTPQTPVTETLLLDGVERASLSFLTAGQWVDGWAATRREGERIIVRLPEAVALELELRGIGPLRQVFLTGEGAR